ncbi:hypothetical protein ABTY20_13010 [Streptomyces sp. NPDC126497]|uniref:hypothetical protein n=1 Tax=Streptomyces sp. NPDC126497 TaxID=3155313 RepID=UPI00332CEA70
MFRPRTRRHCTGTADSPCSDGSSTTTPRLCGAASSKEANRLISRERAAVEREFARLGSWRILTEVRRNARHATTLLRALLVLANTGSRGDRRSPPQ